MNWYYRQGEQVVGPVSSAQLRQLAVAGVIGPATPVRRDNDRRWIVAGRVQGLFPSTRVPQVIPPPVRILPAAQQISARSASPSSGSLLVAQPVVDVHRPIAIYFAAAACCLYGLLGLLSPIILSFARTSSPKFRAAESLIVAPSWMVATAPLFAGLAWLAVGYGLFQGKGWARWMCLVSMTLDTASKVHRWQTTPVQTAVAAAIGFMLMVWLLFRRRTEDFFSVRRDSMQRPWLGYASLALVGLSAVLVVYIQLYQSGMIAPPDDREAARAPARVVRPEAAPVANVAPERESEPDPLDDPAFRPQPGRPPLVFPGGAMPGGANEREALPTNETEVRGGWDGQPYDRAAAPPGGWLVGFEVGYLEPIDHDIIRALRPIFRVGERELFGEQYGDRWERVFEAKAKPGYAVGALRMKSRLTSDGFSPVFMKIVGDRFDRNDAYDGPWLGEQGGGSSELIGGDGRAVRGALVRTHPHEGFTGIGLLYDNSGIPFVAARRDSFRMLVRPAPDQPIRDIPVAHQWQTQLVPRVGNQPTILPPNESRVVGNEFNDHVPYRDVGPPGAFLIGFEFGMENDVIAGLQPIYRLTDKESAGQWHGTRGMRQVRVTAKPDYALSAVRIRHAVGGLMLTFSRIQGDRVDPYDSYDSDVVGDPGTDFFVRLSAISRRVVGIQGIVVNDHNCGLGLIFAALPTTP